VLSEKWSKKGLQKFWCSQLDFKKFLSCCIGLATTVAASVAVEKRDTLGLKKRSHHRLSGGRDAHVAEAGFWPNAVFPIRRYGNVNLSTAVGDTTRSQAIQS
jgi:hypothetical protein